MVQFVLEILDGDRAGDVVALAGTAVRIGRKPKNDVAIVDEKISGVHAELVPEGDRFVLRDLGSTNGTFLDGRRVTEVVLSAGDTFMVGRVHLRFRAEGEAAAPAGDESLTVGRLDTSRLSAARKSSSVALLLVLLVAAAGAGGFVWWRGRAAGDEGSALAVGPKAPLQVAGNRLGEAGACESEAGWELRLAGSGFQPGARAHTGAGAFEARSSEAGGAGGGDSEFAVAGSQEITVLANHALQVAAHMRTEGAARAAVRLHFRASADNNPFHFRSGTALAAAGDWTRVAAQVVVPPDTDRCRVELVAALGASGAVAFDDVALTEAGSGQAVQQRFAEAAATLIGTGPSLAVQSMDRDEPATLLGIGPGSAPPGLGAMLEQDQLCLSDLGAKVEVEHDARGCTIKATGVDRLQLLFPADNAGTLLIQGEQGFASAAAAGEFTAAAVLLGDRATRCLVQLPAAAPLQGRLGGGRFRLLLPDAHCTLAFGFRKERLEASELLRSVDMALKEGRPGEALDGVRRLCTTLPHDAEILAQATARRNDVQAALAEHLRTIGEDLDEAEFFDTRGGFDRAVRALDELRALYGEQNLPDPAAVAALRQRAAERLERFDCARAADERKRLLDLASAFEQTQKAELAALVREYVKKYLPE